MTDYPEHEKLKVVQEKSQAVGEFIDWLRGVKHWQICEYHEAVLRDCKHCNGTGVFQPTFGEAQACWKCTEGKVHAELGDRDEYQPVRFQINNLLGEFFGIDAKKLEQEKVAMLDDIRAAFPS